MNLAALLIPALIQESPQLVAEVISILHKQGKISAQEVADFISSFNTGASFFAGITPATPKP